MNADPVKQAWQASVEIAGTPPLEELRSTSEKFYRRIRLRNRIEYAACALVVAIFTAYVFLLPVTTVRIGAALVVVGALIIAWQLHSRASALPPPEDALVASTLAHRRAQMVRQRDAMASIFYWYLLPLIPGLVLMMFGAAIEEGPEVFRAMHGLGWVSFLTTPAVFVLVWGLNQLAARKLQHKIDEIDALTGGIE